MCVGVSTQRFDGGTEDMLNESRRTLLTNVAKAVPLTAIAIATGSSKSVTAAPKGGNSTTALVNGVATDAAGALAGIFQGTLTVTGVQLVKGVLSAVGNVGTLNNTFIGAPIPLPGSTFVSCLRVTSIVTSG